MEYEYLDKSRTRYEKLKEGMWWANAIADFFMAVSVMVVMLMVARLLLGIHPHWFWP